MIDRLVKRLPFPARLINHFRSTANLDSSHMMCAANDTTSEDLTMRERQTNVHVTSVSYVNKNT